MGSVDKTQGPLYRQLADQLRERIATGWPGTDNPLPPERELALQFGMSRDTVRKALKLLQAHGVVYGDQGRGTFLAPAATRQMGRFLDSFTRDAENRGSRAGQTVLAVEQVPAGMSLSGILAVDPTHLVTRALRVRTLDGAAVGIHDAYLALPNGATFAARDLEKAGSLYALLEARFDIVPYEAIESLGAVAADDQDAARLRVKPGSPLLQCERITLSERRKPVEYCVMRYVPTYRYSTRINRSSQLG